MSAELKEVIITTILQRGSGESYSPIRKVLQVYEKNGEIISESDSTDIDFESAMSFAEWCKKNTNDYPGVDDFNKWKNRTIKT